MTCCCFAGHFVFSEGAPTSTADLPSALSLSLPLGPNTKSTMSSQTRTSSFRREVSLPWKRTLVANFCSADLSASARCSPKTRENSAAQPPTHRRQCTEFARDFGVEWGWRLLHMLVQSAPTTSHAPTMHTHHQPPTTHHPCTTNTPPLTY
jgi:hypothetical protein